jgi:hypothetical protein
MKFNVPVIVPVTGSGAFSVAPDDCGGESNVVGSDNDWLVPRVAGAVLGVEPSNSCRDAAAITQAVGVSIGAGTGAVGPLGSVGVSPTTDAIPCVESSGAGSVAVETSVCGSVATTVVGAESTVDASGWTSVEATVEPVPVVLKDDGGGSGVTAVDNASLGESLFPLARAELSAVSLSATGARSGVLVAVGVVSASGVASRVVGAVASAVSVVVASVIVASVIVAPVGAVFVVAASVVAVSAVVFAVAVSDVELLVGESALAAESVAEFVAVDESADELEEFVELSLESAGAAEATPLPIDSPTPSRTARPPTRPMYLA